MKTTTQKELTKLVEFINDSYTGDYTSVSRDLSKAIYFFIHLEKGMIDPKEVEDICFALHKLSECFYKAHRLKTRHLHQIVEETIDNENRLTSYSKNDDLWLYSL